MKCPTLYYVIPCYNEETVVDATAQRISEKMDQFIASGLISPQSRICFVDDGSTDRTWAALEKLYETNDKVVIVQLNRNYGEQRAYLSGIRFASMHADCVITMDADLQDDLDASEELLREYRAGSEVVLGAYGTRKQDLFIKRNTSRLFYTVMRLFGSKIVPEASTYRILGRRAAEALGAHTDPDIFIAALIPLLGFPFRVIYYDRRSRESGSTHYNLRSMMRSGINTLLSFGVYLPRLLLAGAALDALVAVLAAVLGGRGGAPSFCTAVTLSCAIGAAGFAALYAAARSALRRHLIAKRRPDVR